MTTRQHRGRQRTTGDALSRLGRAEEKAQDVRAAREEAASEERQQLIASWNLRGRIPAHLAGTPDAEIDEQILVMAQEVLYQYERTHGPVLPLLPSPDLTPEQWAARTEAEVAGYAKGVLMDGLTADW